MVSDKFRRQLRQEAEQWRTEGLIEDSVYEQLSQRYQFNDIEAAARNRFVVILLGLGSVLLGLGILAFAAANWQGWPRGLKVPLLLGGFVAVNTAGFYLWRRPIERWQRRLGQGLLLLGALVLGANLVLMSQLFHQNTLTYQWFFLWGLGVLAMAYCLQLTFLGMLSALLIGLGYLTHSWRPPEILATDEFYWLPLMVQYMPVLAGLMFIPLAYLCRSRWIFRFGAIATVYSLEASLIRLNLLNSPAWIAAIACALPPAMLWGYSDRIWGKYQPTAESFQGIARTLAITFLAFLFYILSWFGLWNTTSMPLLEKASPLPLALLVNIVILSGFTFWEWWQLLRRLERTTIRTTIFVAGAIAISAIVPYWHL
ncbi:MAG TPA: DUF2157 domain-containing protein, partial [Coleofasciculaceae cyanobacterium]